MHHRRVFALLITLTLCFTACMSSGSSPAEPALTDATPAATTPDDDAAVVRAAAERAYSAFAHGWATGDFSSYTAMLAPSLKFSFPLGAHRGHVHGAEGHRRMVAKVREHSEAGQRLTLEPPLAIMVEGPWATVLFESHGTFGDHEYRAQNAIMFGISGDRIIGFREFLGDVDPGFVCGG